MSGKLQVFKTEALVVTFDPTLCIHSAECLRGLPAVFDVSRVAWIKPDAAPPDQVVEVVGRCPTGALQAIQRGKAPAPAAGAVPGPGERVRVELREDGPVIIRGAIDFSPDLGQVEPREGILSLCRCGRSANPPFCDGSHGGR